MYYILTRIWWAYCNIRLSLALCPLVWRSLFRQSHFNYRFRFLIDSSFSRIADSFSCIANPIANPFSRTIESVSHTTDSFSRTIASVSHSTDSCSGIPLSFYPNADSFSAQLTFSLAPLTHSSYIHNSFSPAGNASSNAAYSFPGSPNFFSSTTDSFCRRILKSFSCTTNSFLTLPTSFSAPLTFSLAPITYSLASSTHSLVCFLILGPSRYLLLITPLQCEFIGFSDKEVEAHNRERPCRENPPAKPTLSQIPRGRRQDSENGGSNCEFTRLT